MLVVEALGRAPYLEVWERQKQLVEARVRGEVPDTLILVEHDPVFTLGRRREASRNVLLPGDTPVVQVERGGDVTWHGPGQLVAYPIVRLPEGRQDIVLHLRSLEEAVIRTCADFGLLATRDPRNAGAWVGGRKTITFEPGGGDGIVDRVHPSQTSSHIGRFRCGTDSRSPSFEQDRRDSLTNKEGREY